MFGILLGYVVGLLHGMRHALEPDHVAAVSTMIAEQRSARSSVRFAVAWGAGHAAMGAGHAAMLLAVGGLLFALRREMPPGLADAFELGVAIMLVALGLRAIFLAPRVTRGGAGHTHGWTAARRPFLVGLVHGLAGSGALAAMVMSALPTALAGFAFMALYGLGATCGMAALAGVAGVPLARLARVPSAVPALVAVTGVVSMGLGVAWGAPILARVAGVG
jgi:hypothetical protein